DNFILTSGLRDPPIPLTNLGFIRDIEWVIFEDFRIYYESWLRAFGSLTAEQLAEMVTIQSRGHFKPTASGGRGWWSLGQVRMYIVVTNFVLLVRPILLQRYLIRPNLMGSTPRMLQLPNERRPEPEGERKNV